MWCDKRHRPGFHPRKVRTSIRDLGFPHYAVILVKVSLSDSSCFRDLLSSYAWSQQLLIKMPKENISLSFVVSITLMLTCIVELETHLFFPRNFPSDFFCTIKNLSSNRTQSANLFHYFNQLACEKMSAEPNFWKRRMEFSCSVHSWRLFGSSRELEMKKKFSENRHF